MAEIDISKVMSAAGGGGGIDPKTALSIVGAGFIVIIGLVIGVSFIAQQDPRIPEITPTTKLAGGSISCQDWGAGSKGTVNFQGDITAAANNAGIQPALLGAVFAKEHGGWEPSQWSKSDYTTPNPTSGAMGPFQFMPATWTEQCNKYNNDQVKKLGLTPIANCGPETAKDFASASKVSAYYLKYLASRITKNTKTSEVSDIKGTAVSYNGGPGTYDNWKKSGFTTLNNESTTYKEKVWEYFSVLFKGCASTDASMLPTSIDSFDQSFMSIEPLKGWLNGRPKINTQSQTATGITLHWTGSWDKSGTNQQALSKLIDAWHERDPNSSGGEDSVFNHLVIDPTGKVWQMIPLNVRQAGSGTGNAGGVSANDFTIGIEVAGVGPNDVKPGTPAYNGALAAVKLLLANILTIQNIRGDENTFKAKSGIFGHFQTAGGDGIVGCSSRKDDPGLEFMKKLWDDLGAKGNGCYVNNGYKTYYPPK